MLSFDIFILEYWYFGVCISYLSILEKGFLLSCSSWRFLFSHFFGGGIWIEGLRIEDVVYVQIVKPLQMCDLWHWAIEIEIVLTGQERHTTTLLVFIFSWDLLTKKTNIEKRYDSSFKCGSVPLWRRSRRHDISNNHCMQTHAVVNHALTSQSIETCIQIRTETACLLCLQWWEIKIHPVEKCHRCIQISTHQLYIRKWAHKHTHTTHSHGSEVKCARFWTHIYTHRRWEIQP